MGLAELLSGAYNSMFGPADPPIQYSMDPSTSRADRLKVAGQEQQRFTQEDQEINNNLKKWLLNAQQGNVSINPPMELNPNLDLRLQSFIDRRNTFVDMLNKMDDTPQLTTTQRSLLNTQAQPQVDRFNSEQHGLERNMFRDLLEKYKAKQGDFNI